MNGYRSASSLDDLDRSDNDSFRESDDDESEGVLDVLGNVLDPLGIRNIFTGPPSRPPLRPVPQVPVSGGVDRATLTTPQGQATLQLPQPVISTIDFNQRAQELNTAINEHTTRINSIQSDVRTLTDRVSVVVSESKRDATRLRRDIVRNRRETVAQIATLRREQSQQAMTSTMMSFLMQRQIQDQLNTHTHVHTHTHSVTAGAAASGAASPERSEATAVTAGGFNPLLLMMMMGSGQGQQGGGGDMNMWLPMMFAFQ